MAFGTLAFDTLQTSDSKNTGTNKTLDTSFVYNGSAKLWLNLDGSTFGISDSFNISGATDQGTGDYQVSLSNSMANTEWSLTAHSGQAIVRTQTDVTTSSFDINTFAQDGATAGDTARVMTAGHGDLA